MERFTTLTGIAAALPMINIDTDMIIPKQYLKTTKRTGLGVGLLSELRFDEKGNVRPDFVLNKSPFDQAKILITGENFGCGSSREHAPWALKDFGVSCVIASSFADIFYNNCFQNALLPIILPDETVKDLMRQSALGDNATFTIDLERQVIVAPEGEVAFDIDEKKRQAMLNGVDAIGETLMKASDIDAFEKHTRAERPWL